MRAELRSREGGERLYLMVPELGGGESRSSAPHWVMLSLALAPVLPGQAPDCLSQLSSIGSTGGAQGRRPGAHSVGLG